MKRIIFLVIFIMLFSLEVRSQEMDKQEYLSEEEALLDDNTKAKEDEVNPPGMKQEAELNYIRGEADIIENDIDDDGTPYEKPDLFGEDIYNEDMKRDFD